MLRSDVVQSVNDVLAEKFFFGMRKHIVQKEKERFLKTTEYQMSANKKHLLDKQYKLWYESVSNFYLSYNAIFALAPLVARETKIREFVGEEVIRVKADYFYNGVEFSAYYPTHYNISMQKEIDDCISELKNPMLHHIVSAYVRKEDTEKSPHEPLTTAELKFSAFYLYGMDPERVSYLSDKLYRAELITNPETNGWHIDDGFADEMIAVLIEKYGYERVLEYKRHYSDKKVDRESSECIRPTRLSNEYFPKQIQNNTQFLSISFDDPRDAEDAIRLYSFIFYITLSTQMKNSVYDTSSIEITIGNKSLKEQANLLIKGEENWELLTGALINQITHSESSYKKPTIVLPDIMPETRLEPLDIYAYGYQRKRPPRYGVGRFVTQILEKYGLGSNKEQDEIIRELIDSKSVRVIKTMIHPQENAVILISWMSEYLPGLLDFEYLTELNEKIDLVVSGEITLESLTREIERLVEEAFIKANFEYSDEVPSPAKIAYAKRVALKHGAEIPEGTLNSSSKVDIFLSQFPTEQPKKIGSCPKCNSIVYQKEFTKRGADETLYFFSCEEFDKDGNGCTFSIWDSYVYKFFSEKEIELHTVDERANALTKILSKKRGYLFNGFIGKNQKPYDAKVFASSYVDRKIEKEKWHFELEFVNKRKRS